MNKNEYRTSVRALLTVSVLAIAFSACRQSKPVPVTLSYFRLGWSQPDDLPSAEPLSQRFVRETGIQLKSLPVPETTRDQLELSRALLSDKSGPDVLGVDLIWAGALEPDLIDLRPFLAGEIGSIDPRLLPAYEVNGKLVAVPYSVQIGVLEYRTDLLRKYGFQQPPKTWDELERMALRIQAGERKAGNKDFWGYVWQGAAAEGLTCNAIEWQIAEGGGSIIEENGQITVNNPAVIRSWQRAKHWIGWISPPGVIAYRELDSINLFDSGKAAFNRVWGGTGITRTGQSRQAHWRSSLAEGRTGYTSIPGGPKGWAGTLGGSGLAISKHSRHQQEAIRLIRFLLKTQIEASSMEEKPIPNSPQLYTRPGLDEEGSRDDGRLFIARPSTVAGAQYEKVSKAYIEAVHSVLTGDQSAARAAARLQDDLTRILTSRPASPRASR
jgi:trehalose/maltose transport system substrate-binding protein